MHSYPKWVYHASKEPKVVKDEAEHSALGDAWAESPAHVVDQTKNAEERLEQIRDMVAPVIEKSKQKRKSKDLGEA